MPSPPPPFANEAPCAAGASAEQIGTAETALNASFPPDYRTFLAWSNGWEGWLGESYWQLHSCEDLPFANDEPFRRSNPGVVAVGGDGGLETFALDYRLPGAAPSLIALDRVAGPESYWPIASSFAAGVERLKREPDGPWDQADPEPVRQLEAYRARVYATLDVASKFVSPEGIAEAKHFVDHNEAPLGMLTLAWIIVNEERHVPRTLIRDIRAHASDMEPGEDFPPNLDEFAIADV